MTSVSHTARRIAVAAAVAGLLTTACGQSEANTSDTSGDTETASTPASLAGSSPATSSLPVPTTTTPATTSAPRTTTSPSLSTTSTTTTPPTTTPSPIGELSIPIPQGSIRTHPTDLFVLRLDGDLEIMSDFFAGPPTLVADYANPFGPVTEGSGPNVIDDVAGLINGSVVFGDCCEPISGNIRAATASDEVRTIAGGYFPTRSPTGDLLGTANDFLISQTATDAAGAGTFRQINQDIAPTGEGPGAGYLHVSDLMWSSMATATAADDHLVLLAYSDRGWALHDVDRESLEPTLAFELGVPSPFDAPESDVSFIGQGPGSEVVVAVNDGETTRLRYFAPTTLAELPQLERSLPGSATSIRLEGDGMGLLWVDGDVLYYLRAGDFEAERIGSGYLAAWFM